MPLSEFSHVCVQSLAKDTRLFPALKRFIIQALSTVLRAVVKINLITKYPSRQDHGAELGTSQRRPRLGRSVGLLKNVVQVRNIPVTVALQGSVNSPGVLQVDFALGA